MTQNPLRACLVAGVSFALLAGATALAQTAPPADTKPAPGQGERQGPGQGQGQGRQRGPGGPGGGQGPVNLEGAMKGMGRAMKALQANIDDSTKMQENLKSIGDMERNCVLAKSMPLPADVRKEVTDPAERAKLALAFRTNLLKELSSMVLLEQAVMDGKTAEAKTQIEAILKMRDSSHKALDIKDD